MTTHTPHEWLMDRRERARRRQRLLSRLRLLTFSLLWLALFAVLAGRAGAQEATREDVVGFADAYSWWYETPAYPHDSLVVDVLRVARCESGDFDPRVLNNARTGRLGEVGTGQFLPGGIWSSTPQARAGYSVRDPEANVAALTWGIAHGFGPTAWRGCW